MNTKKIYFLLIIIIASLILLYFLFELFSFAEGIAHDTRRSLSAKKEYLMHTYFKGKVIDKDICDKCSELKWGITIQLDTINEFSSFNPMDRVYPPYYEFVNDSLLYMKVPKYIYDKIEIGNILSKRPESIYLEINNTEHIQLLSKDSKKWFLDR